MKNICIIYFAFFVSLSLSAQKDANTSYQKRVLESSEVDILMSYYSQEGIHASVTGGEGTEELNDFTTSIIVKLPINDNDVLTADVGISAFTSASSSNINPFDRNVSQSGASKGGSKGDDDDKRVFAKYTKDVDQGGANPWYSSSGASESDVLSHGLVSYAHSSKSRNSIVSGNIGFSSQYNYSSFGFGGDFTQLFNDKNSQISTRFKIFLDKWKPYYPTELTEYLNYGLNSSLFDNMTGNQNYAPISFDLYTDTHRNSYSFSISFSQILTKKVQASVFLDLVRQEGLLATPFHRVYFADKEKSFIDQFQLADDIEKLPNTRFKLPIGTRFNFYVNEHFVIRSYYRYYYDDWGITAHTASIELPIKIGSKFTISPMYRFYTQTAADYFAPKDVHISTATYYTSDYDLSAFDASQFGIGLRYTDIFTKAKIWRFGVKNIDLRYQHYQRSNDLTSNIVTFGVKFVN